MCIAASQLQVELRFRGDFNCAALRINEIEVLRAHWFELMRETQCLLDEELEKG